MRAVVMLMSAVAVISSTALAADNTAVPQFAFAQFVTGADNRSINIETAQYLRLADSHLRKSGGAFGPSIALATPT